MIKQFRVGDFVEYTRSGHRFIAKIKSINKYGVILLDNDQKVPPMRMVCLRKLYDFA